MQQNKEPSEAVKEFFNKIEEEKGQQLISALLERQENLTNIEKVNSGEAPKCIHKWKMRHSDNVTYCDTCGKELL